MLWGEIARVREMSWSLERGGVFGRGAVFWGALNRNSPRARADTTGLIFAAVPLCQSLSQNTISVLYVEPFFGLYVYMLTVSSHWDISLLSVPCIRYTVLCLCNPLPFARYRDVLPLRECEMGSVFWIASKSVLTAAATWIKCQRSL